MDARYLLRHRAERDMPYGSGAVDDSDYDPHWKDRLLPGNQEIICRENQQANRRHEEYLENSAGIVAG